MAHHSFLLQKAVGQGHTKMVQLKHRDTVPLVRKRGNLHKVTSNPNCPIVINLTKVSFAAASVSDALFPSPPTARKTEEALSTLPTEL